MERADSYRERRKLGVLVGSGTEGLRTEISVTLF